MLSRNLRTFQNTIHPTGGPWCIRLTAAQNLSETLVNVYHLYGIICQKTAIAILTTLRTLVLRNNLENCSRNLGKQSQQVYSQVVVVGLMIYGCRQGGWCVCVCATNTVKRTVESFSKQCQRKIFTGTLQWDSWVLTINPQYIRSLFMSLFHMSGSECSTLRLNFDVFSLTSVGIEFVIVWVNVVSCT